MPSNRVKKGKQKPALMGGRESEEEKKSYSCYFYIVDFGESFWRGKNRLDRIALGD